MMPPRGVPVTTKPRPGQRFWDFPITRILAFLALFAMLVLVIGRPLQFALKTAHIQFKLGGEIGQSSEVGALLGEAVTATAAVSAFLLMVRWADRRSAASAGLGRRGLAKETGLGLLIGGGVFSGAIGVLAALGAYHVSGINAHFQPLVPLLLFLVVAVGEEMIFRGYIFQTLETRWGSGIALAVSALFFGMAHLGNPIAGLTSAQRLIGPGFIVFEASILMTAGYLLTRRLWLPIGLHWGWNFFESAVYGTTESGFDGSPFDTLLRSHVAGPFLITGGPFGPEASLVCLVVGSLAGLFLLRLAVLKGQWRPYPRFHQHPTA